MKVKNLYISWIYKLDKVNVVMDGLDATFEHSEHGVKLALLKKKMFGRYKDLKTDVIYHKFSLFSSVGDLVVSDNKANYVHFIEVFKDCSSDITKEEALLKFSEYENKIYTKMRGN